MAQTENRIPFAVLLGVVWALTCVYLLIGRWDELAVRLFDADDAMRLVQVREYIGGKGWFDLFEPRLDPPTGYDTHWSRLIDVGMAGLSRAALIFGDRAFAEKFMRAAWPLIWLLAAMTAVAAMAWRLAGRQAAILALVIAAIAVPAFQHFRPGRIDHHNVQIALALAVVAATAWSDRARCAATVAGILTALAVAIGLESFPFVAAAGVAFAARFIFERRAADRAISSGGQLAHYGLAVAISMAVIFVLVVKPEFWGRAACDAIAVNWLAASVVAGAGCWLAGRKFAKSADSTISARAGVVVLIAALALAVFLLIEPRCIGGPFALTDRMVKAIWLDHVDETAPLLSAIRGYPLLGVWMCAFPLVGLVCAAVVARDGTAWRDFGFWLPLVSLALAIITTFAAVKIYAYAMWFAMPLVAAVASRAASGEDRRARATRLAAAVILAPTVVTGAAILIVQAVVGSDQEKPGIPERVACTRNDAYAALRKLPHGIVAAEINYGPYVLALTSHTVLAAPYHRIHSGIIAADAILVGPEPAARAIAEQNKVDYVAICGKRASTGDVPPSGSVWGQVNAGQIPTWLEPIARGAEKDFSVYRVRR